MRIVVKDLLPGKQYHLQFRSKNGGEISDWSRTFSVVVSNELSKPLAPENVTLDVVGDSFHAKWNQVQFSEDGSAATDLTGYVVQFRNVDSEQTATFETTDTNFELTFNLNYASFLPLAGKLGVKVAAKNNLGVVSDWSSEVIAQNPPPGPVRNLTLAGGLDSIIAAWEPPANLEEDFKEYRVYVGNSPTFTISASNLAWSGVGTNAVYHTMTRTDHYVKVIAYDKFDSASLEVVAGPARPRSSATADVDAPDTPTNLDGDIDGNVLTVTWTAPANPDNDLAGYQIGYRPVGQTGWSYATASHEDTSVVIQPIERFVNYEVKIQSHDFSFNYSPWSANTTVNGEVNTAPAVPTGLQVKGAITSAMVVWNANTEDDLAGYEVQFKADSAPVDDDPTFPTTGRIISFSENVTQDTLYYARVRAVDTQGLKSAWSAPASDSVGFVDISEAVDPINTLLNNWQAGTGTTYINGGIILTDSIGAGSIRTEEIAADSAFLGALTVDNANISSLEANKLTAGSGIITNMTVKSTLTLGDASNNGVIQSYGYNSNAGVKIDKTGIIVNSGSISAAALNIQSGQNLMRSEYADFEFPDSFYNTTTLTPTNFTTTAVQGGRFNKQSLQLRATATGASSLYLGTTNTDYNIPVESGKVYIISAWVKGGPVASAVQFRIKWSTGTEATLTTSPTSIAANAGWTRFTAVTAAAPSTATGAILSIHCSTSAVNSGFDIDGIQVEEKIGAINTPSAWNSPGTTTIDGAMIRTGEIRSNSNVIVNGASQPMWSINTNGGMQIGSAVIRGGVVVGSSDDGTGSYIQSSNYLAGTSGFLLRGSDGFAEFRNLASDIIGASQIKANAITADKLETTLVLTSNLIAGDPNAKHVELTPESLSVYITGENDVKLDIPMIRLGAEGENSFAITDGINEDATASISPEGEVSAESGSFRSDISVGGYLLMGAWAYRDSDPIHLERDSIMWNTPWGVIGDYVDVAAIAADGGYLTTEASVFQMLAYHTWTLLAGRTYKVSLTNAQFSAGGGENTRVQFGMYTTVTPGDDPRGLVPDVPTASSDRIGLKRVLTPGTGGASARLSADMSAIIRAARNVNQSIGVSVQPISTVATLYNEPYAWRMFVEDLGPTPGVIAGSGYPKAGSTAPPPPPPVRKYTYYFYADSTVPQFQTNGLGGITNTTNNSYTYTWNGVRQTKKIVQGRAGNSSFPYHTWLKFGGQTSIAGHQTGVSLASALSGATKIECKLRLTGAHPNGSSMPAKIGWGTSATTSTVPSVQTTTAKVSSSGSITHVMPSAFNSYIVGKGNNLHLSFGDASTTNWNDAGTIYGVDGTNSQKARLQVDVWK